MGSETGAKSTEHTTENAVVIDDRADDSPVAMPDLPLSREVNTPQELKALADPVRQRILGIIQSRPATAKQIADRLKTPPGTIGHHLQVLEAAGLAQVVARRVVRGIVAKYYTRTARIFNYNFSAELTGEVPTTVAFLTSARDELAEALVDSGPDFPVKTAFPHARLTPERRDYYLRRLMELVDEFIAEPQGSEGAFFALSVALFQSPEYLQDAPLSPKLPTSPQPDTKNEMDDDTQPKGGAS
jgi:DNA-binding transcriptional ArsR family regulator